MLPTATLLFVYGTLQRGERHHDLLAGLQFIGEANTEPRYRLYDCGSYPCLVEAPSSGVALRGEVWRVDAPTLGTLDELEEVPHVFERRPIALADFPDVVWAYFYRRDIGGLRDCGPLWSSGKQGGGPSKTGAFGLPLDGGFS
jgi:gamma-glutamylaminecyclotransferase